MLKEKGIGNKKELTGLRDSFARDSAIRVMASSWRMVMGMEERAWEVAS